MTKPSGFASGFGTGFGVGRYRYVLTPWVWDTVDPNFTFWRLPTSAVGGVDLRPLSAQAIAVTPQGHAFAATLQPVDGIEIANVLDFREENVAAAHQDAWQSAMGYRPQGAKLVDLLWDQLTNGSDPDGITGPKPLLPGVNGQLVLHLGGHSVVKRSWFNLLDSTPHADRVRTLLQRHFQEVADHDFDHACRCLDFTCEKYRLDKGDRAQWLRIVPQAMRNDVRLLPHQTTITDDFNRANADALGSSSEGWSWTEIQGDLDISSNRAITTTGQRSRGRADSDLSSDDHYAQCVRYGTDPGVIVRKDSSATLTYYSMEGRSASPKLRIGKWVANTFTLLTTSDPTVSDGDTVKGQADGSTLTAWINGASELSTTDTAITGSLRAGIMGFTADCQFDNFEAADVAAGVTVPTLDQGMLTGGLSTLVGGLA